VEAADDPFLEAFKARLDEALGSLNLQQRGWHWVIF